MINTKTLDIKFVVAAKACCHAIRPAFTFLAAYVGLGVGTHSERTLQLLDTGVFNRWFIDWQENIHVTWDDTDVTVWSYDFRLLDKIWDLIRLMICLNYLVLTNLHFLTDKHHFMYNKHNNCISRLNYLLLKILKMHRAKNCVTVCLYVIWPQCFAIFIAVRFEPIYLFFIFF